MRLFGLDYLRGLAALVVMIFHYTAWTYGEPEADTVLGRIGIYGVQAFYILSGLTLYVVYKRADFGNTKELTEFFKRRALRIFPLFWVATISMIVLAAETPDFKKVFLNLTGFFGLVSWNDYYAPGAWSIGNELVFYLFFPVFMVLLKENFKGFFLLSLLIFVKFIYVTFYDLDPGVILSVQWRMFTNPINQVFLFLTGFIVGHVSKDLKVNNWLCLLLLVSGMAIFTLIPADGDLIEIVTGWHRIFFTLSCLMVCFGFYKLTYELKHDRPLTLLGEASYSVYLLHPIVFAVVGMVTIKYRILISIPLTLVGSYFVYEYFEKRFMRLSRKKS